MALDKNFIKDSVQNILNREFKSPVEKNVVEYDNRINFRCPYCHEGKVKSKKRGNIYYDRLLMVCFRCDKKVSFDKFCKDFDVEIDISTKMEMIDYLDSVSTYTDYKDDYIDAKISDLVNIEELTHVLSLQRNKITDFKPVVKDSGIFKYLMKRGIHPRLQRNIFQGKYWKTENEYEWVIVMLNRKDDYVLGIQIRNLKKGRRRMFKVYNFESLYDMVRETYPEKRELDINETIMYNKLSYFYNILNINFESKITVFESYLDSLFYPNSIGLVGVNTNTKFLENNGLDIQYFFDNDEIGYMKAETKIKSGMVVFLWQKLFDDLIQKTSKNPIVFKDKLNKIKDLNALCEIVPDAFKRFELGKFFSKDAYDLYWIPKKKYKKLNYSKN